MEDTVLENPVVVKKKAFEYINGIKCSTVINDKQKFKLFEDIYKILDNNDVKTESLPPSIQYYVDKIKSIKNKEYLLNHYTQLLERFKMYFKPSQKDLMQNEAIDNCIKKIEEYNNSKSKQLNVNNSTSSNDSNITQQPSDTIAMQ